MENDINDNEVKSFKEIHTELMRPIPYKFRLQSIKFGKATIVSYIDSRQLQDRLDEVVGAENWQVKYEEIKGNLFASIGILTESGWVWKSDCGTESNVEKEKGEASDSFKRAGVMWGVGRFLYSLPIITLKTAMHKLSNGQEKEYPADDTGKILWSREDINEHCAVLVSGKAPRTGKKETKTEPAKQEAKQLPELYPGLLDKWNAAKDYLRKGGAISSITKNYVLSPENVALLIKESESDTETKSDEVPEETLDAIKSAKSSEELTNLWNELTGLHTSKAFVSAWEKRRKEILLPSKDKKAA